MPAAVGVGPAPVFSVVFDIVGDACCARELFGTWGILGFDRFNFASVVGKVRGVRGCRGVEEIWEGILGVQGDRRIGGLAMPSSAMGKG